MNQAAASDERLFYAAVDRALATIVRPDLRLATSRPGEVVCVGLLCPRRGTLFARAVVLNVYLETCYVYCVDLGRATFVLRDKIWLLEETVGSWPWPQPKFEFLQKTQNAASRTARVPPPSLQPIQCFVVKSINGGDATIGAMLAPEDRQGLALFSYSLQLAAKSERPVDEVAVGDFVLSFSRRADRSQWCRSLVRDVRREESVAYVDHVDYACLESVPLANIRALPPYLANKEAFSVLLRTHVAVELNSIYEFVISDVLDEFGRVFLVRPTSAAELMRLDPLPEYGATSDTAGSKAAPPIHPSPARGNEPPPAAATGSPPPPQQQQGQPTALLTSALFLARMLRATEASQDAAGLHSSSETASSSTSTSSTETTPTNVRSTSGSDSDSSRSPTRQPDTTRQPDATRKPDATQRNLARNESARDAEGRAGRCSFRGTRAETSVDNRGDPQRPQAVPAQRQYRKRQQEQQQQRRREFSLAVVLECFPSAQYGAERARLQLLQHLEPPLRKGTLIAAPNDCINVVVVEKRPRLYSGQYVFVHALDAMPDDGCLPIAAQTL